MKQPEYKESKNLRDNLKESDGTRLAVLLSKAGFNMNDVLLGLEEIARKMRKQVSEDDALDYWNSVVDYIVKLQREVFRLKGYSGVIPQWL